MPVPKREDLEGVKEKKRGRREAWEEIYFQESGTKDLGKDIREEL